MLYMHRYSSLWHFILSLSSQCYLNDISSRIIFHQWFNHLLLFSDLAAIRRLLDSENATGTCPSCDMPFDKGKKRRLIDNCGHERCYSCMFRNEACPLCAVHCFQKGEFVEDYKAAFVCAKLKVDISKFHLGNHCETNRL